MEREKISDAARGLPPDKPCERCSQEAPGDLSNCCGPRALPRAGSEPQQRHSLKHSPVGRRPAIAALLLPGGIPSALVPGHFRPGFFLGSQQPNLLASPTEDETSRSTKVDSEVGTDRYHRSGSGGVFELYNACNGRLVDGRLDLSRLDELSGEELEALDVTRLREVARHAAGCAVCERIIRALTLTRAVIRETAGEPAQQRTQAINAEGVESI